MKVTRKLVVALIGLVVLILVFDAVVQVRREIALFDDDLRRDTQLAGEVLAPALQRIWRAEGKSAALRYLNDIDRQERHVRVHWLPPGPAAAAHAYRTAEDFIAVVPVILPDGPQGALEIRADLSEERRYVRTSVRNVVVTTALIVALCAAAAAVLGAVFVGKPARILVEKARRVGAGDLRQDPPLPQRDELGELSREMNAMCARLQAAAEQVRQEIGARLRAMEQLRHADRLMTVGKLASGIAHELGTPLNIVDGRAQMIADGEVEGEELTRKNARIIVEQAQRMARIIRQLLDFARRGAGHPSDVDVDLRPLVGSTVELLAPAAHKRSVSVRLLGEQTPVMARVNEGELQQVVTNLLVNAVHASERGGEVTALLERRRATPPDPGASEGDYVCLEIADRGTGMDPTTLEHIFEPFFTTKGVGEGTGLGLSVAHGIVRDHGGWIDVTSSKGEGSTFRVYLPAASSAV